MTIEQLGTYKDGLGDNLIKFEMKAECDEMAHFYVTSTKEVYSYEDEGAADDKINEARMYSGFASAVKAFKAGKMNKAGEVVRPETWQVNIKLNH